MYRDYVARRILGRLLQLCGGDTFTSRSEAQFSLRLSHSERRASPSAIRVEFSPGSGSTATLLDVSQSKPKEDYQSDRLAQGKWDWSFTVGGASLKIPSVFDGERIGDAQ